MKIVRRIAWVTVGFTYFLIALGGTVRVSDSGLSCPDWPLCYGRPYAPPEIHALLEESHRYTASIVSILIIALAISALIWARKEKQVLIPALMAPFFLVIQIVLGGLTVLWKLPPTIITAHLGTALAIFAMVITVAVMSGKAKPSKEHPAKTRKFVRLAMTNALLVYGLMLSGSYVVGSGATLACPGWPLCGTAPQWAVQYHLSDINSFHRLVATFVGLVLIWTLISAWRRRNVAPGQAWVALVAGILFVVQAVVGGLVVLLMRPDFVAGLHLALATAVWGSLVLLAVLAARQLRAAPQGAELEELAEEKKEVGPVRQTISSYVDLMKPHVTVLLLGTTVAAMAIAYQGLPPLGLVLATLLGGAMAAGSANCINCYIDRDIDQIMGRTQRRSLPSGRVQPTQALIFGIALGIGSFIILTLFVNLLSALLACSAILFYIFVYTMWLKRSSAQNIVIGGAAGGLGGGNTLSHIASNLALCHHLLLDASTFLGSVIADSERLRESQYTDAASGNGRERDTQADLALLVITSCGNHDPFRNACYGLLLPAGCPRTRWHSDIHGDTFDTRSIEEVGAHSFLVL